MNSNPDFHHRTSSALWHLRRLVFRLRRRAALFSALQKMRKLCLVKLTLAEEYYFLGGAAGLYDTVHHVPAGYIFETAMAVNRARAFSRKSKSKSKQKCIMN